MKHHSAERPAARPRRRPKLASHAAGGLRLLGGVEYVWDLGADAIRRGDGFEELTGYRAGEVREEASWWRERIHPDDAGALESALAAALERGTPLRSEYRLRARDGRWLEMLDCAVLVRDDQGRPARLEGVLQDVTALRGTAGAELHEERMRAEEALRRVADAEAANRAKDEFLAMISHELRTPLGAILIWSQLLRNEKLDEPAAERALGMIERSTRTLAKLIEDLLDVSRIIGGKVRLDSRPLELVPVVDAAVDAAQPDAAAKGVRLEKALDPSVGPVLGDATRLQQIVGNLLSNGIKFTPEAGTVEVRLDRVGAQARIRVSDTGIGISREFLPHLFERFRQADSTSTRRHKGLGLGLAIARHLVELHGGSIEAASPGEGGGSVFTVRLPLARTAVAPSPQPVTRSDVRWAPGETSLDGIRVLVVDDEEDARDALALVLQRAGATVTTAGSAADAWELLRRDRPEVLLSDIAMPGEDGYSFMRRVRALSPEDGGAVPSAAVTAYATADDRQQALEAGYRAHIAKPVDPRTLVATVLDLAGRNESPSEGRRAPASPQA